MDPAVIFEHESQDMRMALRKEEKRAQAEWMFRAAKRVNESDVAPRVGALAGFVTVGSTTHPLYAHLTRKHETEIALAVSNATDTDTAQAAATQVCRNIAVTLGVDELRGSFAPSNTATAARAFTSFFLLRASLFDPRVADTLRGFVYNELPTADAVHALAVHEPVGLAAAVASLYGLPVLDRGDAFQYQPCETTRVLARHFVRSSHADTYFADFTWSTSVTTQHQTVTELLLRTRQYDPEFADVLQLHPRAALSFADGEPVHAVSPQQCLCRLDGMMRSLKPGSAVSQPWLRTLLTYFSALLDERRNSAWMFDAARWKPEAGDLTTMLQRARGEHSVRCDTSNPAHFAHVRVTAALWWWLFNEVERAAEQGLRECASWLYELVGREPSLEILALWSVFGHLLRCIVPHVFGAWNCRIESSVVPAWMYGIERGTEWLYQYCVAHTEAVRHASTTSITLRRACVAFAALEEELRTRATVAASNLVVFVSDAKYSCTVGNDLLLPQDVVPARATSSLRPTLDL